MSDIKEPEHGKCPSCGHCKCCEASTIAEIVAKVMEKIPSYPVPYSTYPTPWHNYTQGVVCWCGKFHPTWSIQYFPVSNAAAAAPGLTTFTFTGGEYGNTKDAGATPGAPLY